MAPMATTRRHARLLPSPDLGKMQRILPPTTEILEKEGEMTHYRLTYNQPYEYDDDSPSGIGDHDIAYSQGKEEFEALDDGAASKFADNFLREGGLNFGSHPGSPRPGYYPRRLVSLVEFTPDREVPLNR